MAAIKVMLVDDHELVRTGVRRLLDDVSWINVIAEADSGEQALVLARQKTPDVVLLDLTMPGIGGLETTRKLKNSMPWIPIIILTVHTSNPFPKNLIGAGAAGYLPKSCSIDEIVQAIKEVHHGKRYISPTVAQSLVVSMLSEHDVSPFESLSQREMQVMLMLIQGKRVRDISDSLHLSPKTISTYRCRLFEKLGVSNDAEMTRLAIRYGILD